MTKTQFLQINKHSEKLSFIMRNDYVTKLKVLFFPFKSRRKQLDQNNTKQKEYISCGVIFNLIFRAKSSRGHLSYIFAFLGLKGLKAYFEVTLHAKMTIPKSFP